MAVENEAPAEANAAIVNPDPAEAEAEVPGEEEVVAPLPEPWIELMTDAGEPYVSQVFFSCIFTKCNRSFLYHAMPPPTKPFLSSHLLSLTDP